MNVKYSVDGEETFNTINCWILSMTTTMQEEDMTMKTVVTWWMAKSDLHMVHGRIQTYADSQLIFQQEFDPSQAPEEAGEPPEPIDVNYIVGYETITVTAGTFANCIKVEVTQEGHLGRTWAHQSVPIYGIVKSEMYEDGELVMTMELKAYGG